MSQFQKSGQRAKVFLVNRLYSFFLWLKCLDSNTSCSYSNRLQLGGQIFEIALDLMYKGELCIVRAKSMSQYNNLLVLFYVFHLQIICKKRIFVPHKTKVIPFRGVA